MKALYIHGFNSAGFGGKADALRAAFGSANVINPTLPTRPADAMALLDYLVSRLKGPDFLILGSSLGGFYALNLALHHQITTILVNPAVRQVAPGLAYALGTVKNYKTGESYQWSQQDLDDLNQLELQDRDWPKLKGHVRAYLDAEDEVLPAPEIAAFLEQQGIATHLYPGGNHQFSHMDELLLDLRQTL
ncbi:MAG: esterase [Candidatus Melainabacteria bacterium HGW-Melainabacteria-1]|nr:MAG: esterase [Candidatus Melainabacteria bacterium HGW-Melainabacteria-1]